MRPCTGYNSEPVRTEKLYSLRLKFPGEQEAADLERPFISDRYLPLKMRAAIITTDVIKTAKMIKPARIFIGIQLLNVFTDA